MEIINLDMTPSTVTPNAHAGQYDASRAIRFMLKNGGVPFTLAGTETITAEITRSDNTEVTVNVANTSSNYVDVIFDDTVCTVKGLYACELRLKDSDGFDIGSKNFALLVQRDPYADTGVHVETVGPADICTFETNLAEPLQSVIVDIEATGGNGTPDNPNPINGYTEVNIVNTQNESIADLFSIDSDFRGTVAWNQKVGYQDQSISSNGITISLNSLTGKITVTVNNPTGYAQISFTNSNMPKGHKILLASNTALANGMELYCFNIYVKGSYETPRNKQIIGETNNSANVYFYVSQTVENGTYEYYITAYDLTEMFGSTIADYIYGLEQATAGAGVAFFRNIYPEDYYAYDSGTTEIVGKETPEAVILFGQTVYGGVLDVTRGKLHVTHEIADFGDYTWFRTAGIDVYIFTTTEISNRKFGITNIKSDIYQTTNVTTWDSTKPDLSICGSATAVTVVVRDDNYTSASDFKTANTGHKILFELATPFDIDLTPVQINALALPDSNNVFADCGQTTVKYLKAGA